MTLLLRSSARLLAAAPPRVVGSARPMCAIAKFKAMEKKAAEMAPYLDPSLKAIVDKGATLSAEMEGIAKTQPELYKVVMEAVAVADKPGIMPTVAVAKNPLECKYTEEGTLVHTMMKNVAAADRRAKVMSEMDIPVTAADKAYVKGKLAARAEELGIPEARVDEFIASLPTSTKLTAP